MSVATPNIPLGGLKTNRQLRENRTQKQGSNLYQGGGVLLWVNRVVRGDEDETVPGQCIPVAPEFIVG